MRVALRDRMFFPGGACPWMVSLRTLWPDVDCGRDDGGDPDPDGDWVLFLHPDTQDIRRDWEGWARRSERHHLVIVNRGGRTPAAVTGSGQRVYACWWSPEEVQAQAIEGTRRLVGALRRGDLDWWRWLQPVQPQALLSWVVALSFGQEAEGEPLRADAEREFREMGGSGAFGVDAAGALLRRLGF